MSLVVLSFAVRARASEPPTLLPNGSFEAGRTTPAGWRIRAGGEWATGEAHHGRRYLSGRSAKDDVVVESDIVVLQPKTDYRLQGWLRCSKGEGRLGVDLLDKQGRIVRRQQAPRVRGAAEWRYVPLECKPEMPGTIPNGFVRDMGLADRPGFDSSRGGNRSPSFRTSEPWLVHNMFYLLAARELHLAMQKPSLLME